MIQLRKLDFWRPQAPSTLLGLVVDGGQFELAVLRRTNGSLQVQQRAPGTLSLDPLTNDPELVGREIRNQLDAHGVRERRCVVGLPLKWALTLHIAIPDLPEADLASFLEIEAERGFPCDVATLVMGRSYYTAPSGARHATLVGVSRSHVERLERVLRAAQLKPVSFSLGIAALEPPSGDPAQGTLALAIGDGHVGLQVTTGGGVAALRALEGAIELEGSRRVLHADVVAREVRITLGQLPAELRQTLREIHVFGPRDLAQQLADEMDLRLESMNLEVKPVTAYPPAQFEASLPSATVVSPAFSLAAARLTERASVFEFLPPHVTAWEQFAKRYSSGKFQRIGVAAGAAGLLVAAAFLVQQWQLSRLRWEWARMEPQVRKLEGWQQQIRQFRPWTDKSVRSLTILRQLTEAFPEDGSVSAKTFEIRDQSAVACSGVARDNRALLRTLERLRVAPSVSDVKVPVIRGKSPMQFTFEFRWNEGAKSAN